MSNPYTDPIPAPAPYADGSYGHNSASASTELAADQSETFADQQALVMHLAERAGYAGITGHDVQVATGWGDSSKSRALSNLLRDRRLVRLREKRDRGHIHVVPELLQGRDIEPYQSLADKHYYRGHDDGLSLGHAQGLERAFEAVDNADSLGEALIALRQMITEARG
ncbi:helix-turn-helix DNA binding domain protein [Microbacterium phage Jefe]|uniref:Uncharacterized protein n=3 Tax=Quhwahvirus TaxID=2733202 RepID=A0A7L7SNS5_9CAUD|nr:hypothetical protein SEA_ANTARES_59 [Microbacterium phage Antares]QOC58083.1 hypothetical protein SEA_SCUMBERLAND_61 [Microbacterium phage Scumberland]UQT01892.1 hypothetical protein SEA_SAVANNAH_58 [Microbacterium phage Savannah]UXE04635.1 helix-turn-helix DNA binding domain protein [Microbacterium phage Cranjis]WBF79207.1 helix-turn-helix DNA binding domain protein [Microbacterium phage Jefe]WNM67763.1 helix-turn-helix DNA binding domain protein [Microbacterium phage LittleFortune]